MVKKSFNPEEEGESSQEAKTEVSRFNLNTRYLWTLADWLDRADMSAAYHDERAFFKCMETATGLFLSVLREGKDLVLAEELKQKLDKINEFLRSAKEHSDDHYEGVAKNEAYQMLKNLRLQIRQEMDARGMLRSKMPIDKDLFDTFKK